jgi:hypothetical protein
MEKKRWFPEPREAQYNLIRTTTTFMADAANRAAIGYAADTPNGAWYDTILTPNRVRYDATYQLWANIATRTKPVIDDLRDAEKAFFPLYRLFYAGVKASPLVSNACLEAMGFPPRPTGEHKRHPVDRLFLNLSAMPMGFLVLRLSFENRDTGSSVKPDYLTGAVIYYMVSDTPVTNPDLLTSSRLATRSPYLLAFDASQCGKTVYLAARWQNRRGELGPWSNIVAAVIP